MKPFVDAIDMWCREGLHCNFIFAGREVQLKLGEEFADSVCRTVEKIESDQVSDQLNTALDWWASTYLDLGTSADRASFKFLELLMLIAIKGRALNSAPYFIKAFSSTVFQSLPETMQFNLISQCVTMVGEWCLPDDVDPKLWSPQENDSIYEILRWFPKQSIDEQDALVCLASMAHVKPERCPQYFLDIFQFLPTIEEIKKVPEEFKELQSVFELIKYDFKKLFSGYPDKSGYQELFGLDSTDLNIWYQPLRETVSGRIEVLTPRPLHHSFASEINRNTDLCH